MNGERTSLGSGTTDLGTVGDDPTAMPEPAASPIVRILNQDVGRYHRWCTPSILEHQERVDRLLRLGRLDLGRLLRHARRSHGRVRRGRAVRGGGAGRRPHDVLGPRDERIELDRAADAGARALRRARARRPQHPPLDHERAEGLRARLPLPADAVRAALRGAAAAERRGDPRGSAPLPGGDRRHLHEPDLRGPGGEHARDRGRRPRHLAPRDGDRRRGVGRAPALPRRAAGERDGVRAPTSPCSRRTSSPAGCSRPG